MPGPRGSRKGARILLIGTHAVTAAKSNKPKARPYPNVTRGKTQLSQRMGVAELNETIREFHRAAPEFTNDPELMNEAKKEIYERST